MGAIIQVASTTIRTLNGLYSLNDLHKASGGEKRHQPSNWLRSSQAVDLIKFLKNEELPNIEIKQGLGTFACQELVVHYGMWISAAFSLQVIQAFLAAQETPPETTTVTQREGLRQAVHFLVGKRRLHFNDAYKLVHQRFGVEHIEDLPADKLPEAVAYVHTLALDTGLHGEVLDAPRPPAKPQGIYLTDSQFHALAVLTRYMSGCCDYLYSIVPALETLGSSQSGRAYSLAHESYIWLDTCRQAVTTQHKHMQPGWSQQQVAKIVADYR